MVPPGWVLTCSVWYNHVGVDNVGVDMFCVVPPMWMLMCGTTKVLVDVWYHQDGC